MLGSFNFSSLVKPADIDVTVTTVNTTLANQLTNLIEMAYASGTVPVG